MYRGEKDRKRKYPVNYNIIRARIGRPQLRPYIIVIVIVVVRTYVYRFIYRGIISASFFSRSLPYNHGTRRARCIRVLLL